MPLSPAKLKHFPRLEAEGYEVTSIDTYDYNCIAFAADDQLNWWWPDAYGGGFWPPGVPREETIAAFIAAYNSIGYEVCQSSEVEDGYEKIAIYSEQGAPSHAAKQNSDGTWKSKLGKLEDINHSTLTGLYGSAYGQVAVLLRRLC